MIVRKTSPYTGKTNKMDLNITQEQVDEINNPQRTKHIQNIVPHLTAIEREFLLTGYTGQDWEDMFGKDEEE